MASKEKLEQRQQQRVSLPDTVTNTDTTTDTATGANTGKDTEKTSAGSEMREGKDPFDYTALKTVAENQNSLLEVVAGPGKDEQSLRKTKFIRDSLEVRKLLQREIEFLFQADHPAFPKAYGFFSGVHEGKWVASTLREYVPGHSLDDIIDGGGSFLAQEAIDYASQVLDGLNYIHQKERLHRDIKPSNFILKENSKSAKYPYGQIKITDLDSLGFSAAVQGTGGSTYMVGTGDWHHPNQYVPGGASVTTDLFAVGTSLFYFLLGRKPHYSMYPSFTITEEDLQTLEKKLQEKDGGPELARTVKKLVSPDQKQQYTKAPEVMDDLRKIQKIIDGGYELVDKKFQVHQETIDDKLTKFGARCIESTKEFEKGIAGFAQAMIATPLRLSFVFGIAAGIGGYFLTADHLQEKSANRAVYFTPEISTEAPAIISASAAVSNTANKINALYVQLNSENRPNDVVLLREIQQAEETMSETRTCIADETKEIDSRDMPMDLIGSGGALATASFQHTKRDNYHTVCVTVCSSNGKTTSCHPSCHQVYDNTDHWWTPNHQGVKEGKDKITEGLKTLVPPTFVSLDQYSDYKVPEKDALGRKVVVKDEAKEKLAYQEGKNEWLEKGPVIDHNALVHPQVVSEEINYHRLVQDINLRGNLEGHPDYQKKHVNNTCPDCDERDAPRGYITVKRVAGVTGTYVEHHNKVRAAFYNSPLLLAGIQTELQALEATLNSGKRVSEADLRNVADKATELYKTLVPESEITAPTAGERTWIPFGIGGGILALSLFIGTGISALQGRFDSYGGYGYQRRRTRGW